MLSPPITKQLKPLTYIHYSISQSLISSNMLLKRIFLSFFSFLYQFFFDFKQKKQPIPQCLQGIYAVFIFYHHLYKIIFYIILYT